jgi:hypothetical protein
VKHFIYGLIITLLFSFCNSEGKHVDTKIKCVVDSVEYHPIGFDNTLQTEPYWKLHLKDYNFKVRSYRQREKGDTIEIIERKYRK